MVVFGMAAASAAAIKLGMAAAAAYCFVFGIACGRLMFGIVASAGGLVVLVAGSLVQLELGGRLLAFILLVTVNLFPALLQLSWIVRRMY
jgi:hypothetical protein